MANNLQVLLLAADDRQRQEIQSLVERAPGEAGLVSAKDLYEAADMNGPLSPDVALLGLDGLDSFARREISRVHHSLPGIPLLVISPEAPLPAALDAVACGAQDCLVLEPDNPDGLWRAIQLALARTSVIQARSVRGLSYKSIVDNLTEFIVRFRPDGTITFANSALASFLGLTTQQVLWASFRDLLKSGGRRGLFGAILSLDRDNPQTQIEAPIQGKGVRPCWLRWAVRALSDQGGHQMEYQAVGVDITIRKDVEKALQTAEANLRQLIFNNADGLVVTDLKGRILFVNPAGQSLLGASAWESMPEGFLFKLSEGDRREITLTRSDGEEVVAEVRVAVTKWQDQPAYLASLRDITELVRLREKLRSTSLTDDLTGINNRRGFMTLGGQLLKTAQRMNRAIIMFFMDMDRLKEINDTYGHAQGDRAINETTVVLKTTFRESDILARVGGDEFAVLALTLEGEDTDFLVDRLQKNLDSWNETAGRAYRLALSVGHAVCDPGIPRTVEDLLLEADQMMYDNKRADKALESGDVLPTPPNWDQSG